MRPPLRDVAASDSLSLWEAAARLEISIRRVRGLIKSGALMARGTGRNRRVIGESLVSELAWRAQKRKSASAKAEILDNLPDSVSALAVRGLDRERQLMHDSTMLVQFPLEKETTIAVLLPIARAAALVGLSDAVLNRLVESGEIPSVQIGGRRRINAELLRAWSRSELRGGAQ